MVVEVCDRSGTEVRERADVEDGASVDELSHEPGILFGADAVPQPVRLQALERASHRRGAGDLARMRDGAEAERLRVREYGFVRLRREFCLEAAEPHPDDAAVHVTRAPLDGLARLGLREPARDVRGEP